MFRLRFGRLIVYFGEGSTEALAEHIYGVRRVLVVTGRSSARRSGALADVIKILNDAGIEHEVFDHVFPNPTDSVVDSIVEKASESGVEALIAIGGGSVIDSTKFASVLLCSGGKARDYLLGDLSPRCSKPVYAVNLTHGTGSEVDRYSVANIEGEKLKIGIDTTYPEVSVDNPRYALTLPLDQTRYTSIDAFYHSLESSTSTLSNPLTETLASESVSLIAGRLPRVLKSPGDIEAREDLLYAASIAGVGIDNSLTHVVHSLEHTLSGENPMLPHGAGLAILGPRSIRYMYKARPQTLARILRPLDPDLRPLAVDAERAEAAVRRFQEGVGLVENLADYGFSTSDADRVASKTLEVFGKLTGVAPFSVSEEILVEIYKDGF